MEDEEELEEMRKLREMKGFGRRRPKQPVKKTVMAQATQIIDFQEPTVEDIKNSAYEKTRRRKVVPASKTVEDEIKERRIAKNKAPAPILKFGFDTIPQLEPGFGKKPREKTGLDVIMGEVDEEVEDDPYDLPITHEVLLKGHTKAVSALTIDKTGSRMISGGLDYKCRFWNFAGMDQRLSCFRDLEPMEGQPIKALSYSKKGSRFIVAPAGMQARVFTRDGKKVQTFAKGYMYIADMKHTSGHIGGLTHCMWHPTDDKLCLTSSLDSTVRIWDYESGKQKEVIKVKGNRGGVVKVPVSTFTVSKDNKYIAAASQDGGIYLYSGKGPYTRAKKQALKAHTPKTDTSSLAFSSDTRTLISRGRDDTLKVWDVRKFTRPLETFSDLSNRYDESSCLFSPKDDLIVCGTSCRRGEGTGDLVFVDKKKLEIVKRLPVSQDSVIAIAWNDHINQIFVGCADNHVHCLYSPEHSTKGVLLSVVKKARKRTIEDTNKSYVRIKTPHAIKMFRDEPSRQTQRKKAKLDPRLSARPEAPVAGPGKGGKLGTSVSQHLLKQLVRKEAFGEDPREALLKYADKTKESPFWFKVYNDRQEKDKEEDEALRKTREETKNTQLSFQDNDSDSDDYSA
mmetsp:Transcript_2144/g.2396  ORF Transcript_2144/g.2396 Transcript_2144/m.2396 type:complete len:623 (+) Transcript_2144:69-1937(+)